MVVIDEFGNCRRHDKDERKDIAGQIEEQEQILSSARKKFMKDEIDETDFKITKKECTKQLQRLEARLIDLPNRMSENKTVEGLMDRLIERHVNLLDYFKNQDIETKRHLISSMYPENLYFDGIEHRTPKLNTVLEAILHINSILDGKNKGERYANLHLSPKAARRESNLVLNPLDINDFVKLYFLTL